MVIDVEYIREKYPKCCVLTSKFSSFEVNENYYCLSLDEFNTLEEFEEKYSKVLNGLGYLILFEDRYYYDRWKRESEKYFIYLCII